MSKECNICIEKFTKHVRKKLICNQCKFESCMSCVKQHFKTSEKEPSCMNCFEKFTEDFLYDNFPKAYINKDIKEFRQNLLFEAEKELLPITQEQAKYDTYIKELEGDVDIDEQRAMEIMEKYNALWKEINKKKKLISNWYQNYTIPTDTDDEVSDVKEKRVFIKQCPSNECNGYLSTRWKCDMCDISVCKECLEIKQDDHVCDANNMASAKEILKNTKPCPSCGTSIYKIHGCSQMWCTHCKTAFDWNSGKIVTAHIHNPHYYEWKRQNGNTQREIGDVVCGGIPEFGILYHMLHKYHDKTKQTEDSINQIYSFHRIILHVHDIELQRLNAAVINNVDLRIKYLNKQITLEKYKQTLLLREKRNRNKRNMQLIFITFRDAGSDILQRLITQANKKTDAKFVWRSRSNYDFLEPFITEMDNLINFINKAFFDLSKKYNFVTKFIFKFGKEDSVYFIDSINAKPIK